MKTFEIGKTYTTNFIGDHTLFITFMVTDRTAKTVTLQNIITKEISKRKIIDHIIKRDGIEAVYPNGHYSMAPILTAEDIFEEV